MSDPETTRTLGDRLWDKAHRLVRRARFLRSVRRIHGPRQLKTGPGDVTVVTLVKDGRYYLDEFLRYYRSIGARHFVFIDNGSTDGTVERLGSEPGTVVLQSLLPAAEFESDMRRHAAEKFCRDRWCLFADVDELFDFEGRADIGLAGLVGYLAENGYSALVAQMLDLFPEVPLRQTSGMNFAQAVGQYRYFDPGHVTRLPYHDRDGIAFSWFLQGNSVPDDRIGFLFGGVRHKVFGEMCCLTKHPLVFVGQGVEAGVHPHCSAQVACADFTALIRHYKFTDDPLGRDAQTVAQGTVSHGEDRQRLAVFRTDPDLSLYSAQALEFDGFETLYKAGFLVKSQAYTDYVAEQAERG